MDYDDNDLNSQNFHLAGEGSAKFPPGLQPYALPKFDFDDSLQSHLRFDSLVETEVFLGIESNQDNNWIEDFSRGSSGIEFNSSAAEPCSISRRDNVWSEATSSESVEMLLKSVGQEEVIGVLTITEESDACDELGCVTKQMDHSLEDEENILPGTVDVKVVENTIPSDEEVVKNSENTIPSEEDVKVIENTLLSHEGAITVENTLSPNEDVLTLETSLTAHEDVETSENAVPCDDIAGNSPDKGDVGEGQSGFKDTSQTQGVKMSVGGDSNLFNQSSDGEKSALHLNEEVFANIGCGDEIQRDIDDFPEKHVDVQTQGEPITPSLPSDISVVPIQDVVTAVNEVIDVDVQHQTSDILSEKPDDHVLRKEAGIDDQDVDGNIVDTPCLDEKLVRSVSEEETLSKVSLEVSTCIVEKPCSGTLKGQSDFCTVGDESLETMTIIDSKCEDVMMREGIPHDDDQLRADKPDAPMCDAQFESSQIHTSLEPSVDYIESSIKIDVFASGPQLDDKDYIQNPDVVVSSTEKSNTEIRVIATNLAEPTLTPEKVRADAEHVSISEEQNARMLNACSNMDIDSPVKEAESSPGQDESRKELDTPTLQHVTVVDGESAAAVTSSDLVSQATSDVVPVPFDDGVTIEVDQQSSQIPLPIVGSNELEEKDETFCKTVTEPALSLDAVSSTVEAGLSSVSEAEKSIPCDTDRPSSSKVADQSLPPTNSDGIETITNASASTIVEVSMECTEHVAEGDATKAMVLSDTIVVAGNFVPNDAAIDSEPNMGKETIVLLSESPLPSVQQCDEYKINLPTSVSSLPLVQPPGSCLQVQDDNGGSSADQRTQVPASSELSQSVLLNNGASSLVQNLPIPGSPMLSQSVEKSEKQDASASKVIGDKVKHKASNSRAPKATAASMEEKTGSSLKLSKGAARRNLLPLPTDSSPKIAERSPSSSLPGQLELKIAQETPQANTQVSEVDTSRGRPKSTSERKPRRSSVKATAKESAKKGSQPKETTPMVQPEKLNNVSLSPPAIFHVMQSNEMQPYGHIDANNSKPYFVLATSTSTLPDLNSSASPSTVFQQPFTDFQQVQLRAQIFVYGALIQGTAPEEAYMVSAFGGLDGGRNLWCNAWQASIERLQSNKSTPINPETPKNSRLSNSSVSRPVDQVSKQSAAQNKGAPTPVGRSTTKSSQSVVSPMIPLSSPLWNMPTPMANSMQSGVLPRGSIMDYQQTLPHLHPLQTPPSRSLAGNNTSRMSQPSYCGPWQSSGLEARYFSGFPSTETAQLTPVKETSVSQTSVKNVPFGPTGAPTSVFTAGSPLVDLKKGTPSHVQQSAEPKTRKRKKNSAQEETTHTVLQSQPQFQPAVVPIVSSNLPTSAIKTPSPIVSQATLEKSVLPFPSPSFLDPLRKQECDVTQRATLSENSLVTIKEASKHAEDATALASAAVGHSQEVWSQLENQKKLGLVSDREAKLACAAVAVAAAAAVARAASAAANVASNAALQAKLMAEEVFGLNSTGNSDYATRILSSEGGSVSEKVTHASISRGHDIGSNSSSILTAAREAARRKVEAASAASMRAENMDAIVKAAELAAEAVSQAGKIVAMGDPFPLSELIEAGPEGYWRTPELVAKSTEMSRELFKARGGGEGANTSTKHQKGGRSGKKGAQMTVSEQSSILMDVTTWSESEPVRQVDDISCSVPASVKETRGQNGSKVSDLTKNIVVVLESEPLSKSFSFNVDNEVEKAVQAPQGNSIKEGSKVEVFKDDDGFKAAWYTAVVLSLNEGKACVSYTEIEQEEGSTQLEEWVALAGEGDNSPRIRIARPVTTLQYEGTRKRRRAAIGDYNWTVGDRVDAWMTNSWWEGVVTEKNKRDETSVTVHFPAQNETSIVKAWNLRLSLNWKDGEWVEWSNLQHDFSLQEGDIRLEKRPKLGGSPAVELKGKHKISSTSDAVNSAKPEEPRLLELSGIEQTFNVGKGSNRENKPDSTRMARTGLQKEGSKVVFGIPKPGKKRKFMEVSKHYVADKSNKNNEPSDSLKHLLYSVPQGSRALRNDPKEKRVAESKLKGFKPVKQQTAFGRTIPQKNFSSNSVSSSADSGADATKGKDYSGHNMSLRKQNTDEAGSLSNSEGASDGQFVFSAVASSDARPSRKITPSVKLDRANKGKLDRTNKGKLAPAARKLGKIEEDKAKQDKTVTSTSEAVEPRRSNRRIQPTSRLLEGLQSSLIIPKFPSFAHDKGQRTQSKHTSRGNNHGY